MQGEIFPQKAFRVDESTGRRIPLRLSDGHMTYYRQLNQELFDGKLPIVGVYEERHLARRIGILGFFNSQASVIVLEKGLKIIPQERRDLRCILLHEMAHVAVFLRDGVHSKGFEAMAGHGDLWQEEIIRLVKLGESRLISQLFDVAMRNGFPDLLEKVISLRDGLGMTPIRSGLGTLRRIVRVKDDAERARLFAEAERERA